MTIQNALYSKWQKPIIDCADCEEVDIIILINTNTDQGEIHGSRASLQLIYAFLYLLGLM